MVYNSNSNHTVTHMNKAVCYETCINCLYGKLFVNDLYSRSSYEILSGAFIRHQLLQHLDCVCSLVMESGEKIFCR